MKDIRTNEAEDVRLIAGTVIDEVFETMDAHLPESFLDDDLVKKGVLTEPGSVSIRGTVILDTTKERFGVPGTSLGIDSGEIDL